VTQYPAILLEMQFIHHVAMTASCFTFWFKRLNACAGVAKPGCLIALDTSGKVVNEVTSPGINGPWGSVCTVSDGRVQSPSDSLLLYEFLMQNECNL